MTRFVTPEGVTKEQLLAFVGTWGRPPDVPSKIALGLGVVLLALAAFGRGRSVLGLGDLPLRRHRFLALAALAAALLSVGYTAVYLRGGPRIVDATTYWLEGRALFAEGFRFSAPFPSASFRGRFLLAHGDGTLAGIFPPGQPLLLAIGFALGSPMLIGPLLAGALVVATYRLVHELGRDLVDGPSLEIAARGAAILSLACAALRYHTADTMAHGATALGIAIALERALVASRRGEGWLVLGLVLGLVAATRPVSALGIGVVAVALVGRSRGGLLRVAIGALPGLLLLAWGQHGATGTWLTSSQRAYYAVADGPSGCFRYGFGEGVGCLHEHGEFVRARLGDGYGLLAAAGTTLRRLHLHLVDVANLEVLALVALALPLARPLRTTPFRAALGVVVLHVLAYVPFYFDGNYPGGGARLLADVLPVEHALLLAGVAALATRRARRVPGADPSRRVVRATALVLGLSLVGFSVHAAHAHVEMAWRDGGRPMFEPDVVTRAHVTNGLLFVDTDHGFGLAHVPGATTATGLVVARLREDDHDGLLYERLGKPPTWIYRRGLEERGAAPIPATVTPFTPPALGASLRFESEADWPPLAQDGGFAVPTWTDACAGGSRALVLTPDAADPEKALAHATVTLPVPKPGRYRVTPRILHGARAPFTASPSVKPRISGTLRVGGHTFSWTEQKVSAAGGVACEDLAPAEILLSPAPAGPEITVALEASGGPVALDRIILEALP